MKDAPLAPSRPWWRGAVFYQVYPRSFADGNGDGVGDLRGLRERLDHLVDLGVDALWLSPVCASPMRDNGYDVRDYCAIDPIFGTLSDFDAVLAEAHGRGLRIVMDLVLAHTSDQHPWFVASRSSRDSQHRDWYMWRDGAPDGGPPNNWRSAFPHVGPAWTRDERTGQWYLHSHLPEQPDLNWDHPEVRGAAADVMRFWLDRGVDGFRVDAVARMGKDPSLADEDPSDLALPRRQQDWPSVHGHLAVMRSVVEPYGDRLLLGEIWLFDQERVAEYARRSGGLHLVHNMAFPSLPWHASTVGEAIKDYIELTGPEGWPAWLLNNHDWPRSTTRFSPGAADATLRARVGALLVLTLRGTPFLYQGEELGLPDVEIGLADRLDAEGRDGCRTPLPWLPPSEAGPGAGFTTGSPWLPVGPAAEVLAVSRQAEDPTSTLAFYRRALQLRRNRASLREGSFQLLPAPAGALVYERDSGDERSLVALNLTSRSITVELPKGYSPAQIALSTHLDRHGEQLRGTLVLRGDEGIVVSA